MENFDDCWIEDDFEESVDDAIEKIHSLNNSRLILKDLQITKASHLRRDLNKISKQYIKLFFKNKKNYMGEKIKKEDLYNKKYIDALMDFSIPSAARRVYSILGRHKKYLLKDKHTDVTNDIKLVNETLKKIYKSKIPQQFAGGLLLMYLEICKGVDFEI